MSKKQLLRVLRSATEDEEYCRLAQDHERLAKQYLKFFSTLTEEQQAALADYWAVVHAMHQHACWSWPAPKYADFLSVGPRSPPKNCHCEAAGRNSGAGAPKPFPTGPQ